MTPINLMFIILVYSFTEIFEPVSVGEKISDKVYNIVCPIQANRVLFVSF